MLGTYRKCVLSGSAGTWVVADSCTSQGMVCSGELLRCTVCQPDQSSCNGQDAVTCLSDGSGFGQSIACNVDAGEACRSGGCLNLCAYAAEVRSNMGCEYWGADLDNAFPDPADNAAAQQYAIVVSNPQPDLTAHVTIEQDDSTPGDLPQVVEIASDDILPMNLRVFKLGPREVDGSPDGEFNTGTGTALTRHGYRIRSQIPVVAYQFNPLDNVNVFSNDASLLKPVEALMDSPGTLVPLYVVTGWPQTIAHTDDPDTNFGDIDLRAFVTIIGTRPDSHVTMTTTTDIIEGGPLPATPAGATFDVVLQPFDVLNLETGGFNADFTGSLVQSNQPVVVFSGSEASDAPWYSELSERRCCADHLRGASRPDSDSRPDVRCAARTQRLASGCCGRRGSSCGRGS